MQTKAFLSKFLFPLALCLAVAAGALASRVVGVSQGQHLASDVDIGFAQSMLVHHNQALQMASMVRQSKDPAILGLAESIIRNQLHEVGLLTGWLTAWGAPITAIGKPMAWVENAQGLKHLEDQLFAARCKANNGVMEGMATVAQLQSLANAKGTEQSRLFLELMIAHHKSALPMANFAFRNGQSTLIKGMARTVVREQNAEIGHMQNQLALTLQTP